MKTLSCSLLAGIVLLSTPFTASAQVVITEFMASNSRTLLDEDGESPDWIEIQNLSSTNVNLLNWSLTDKADNLNAWRFPATNLNAGSFLVIFASNKDRRTPGAPLHSSFGLGGGGEYLALVRPDGTIASQFSPAYPAQVTDVSYGFGIENTNFSLIAASALVRAFVPTDPSLAALWTLPDFNDSNWIVGTNGVGFDTGVADPAEDFFATTVASAAPIAWYRFSEAAGAIATNLGSLGSAANGSYLGAPTLAQAGPRPPAFGGFESDNNAPRLNGTTGRVQVPDVSAFDLGTGPFSLALWFNPANASTRGDLFTYKGTGGDFGIHVASAGANTVSVYHNAFIGTGGGVTNNNWSYIVWLSVPVKSTEPFRNAVALPAASRVKTK